MNKCCNFDNDYELNPIELNLSQYNRYPFANYDDAVNNLMAKNLKPGEFGVAYYWDEDSDFGISTIFAIGNLKRGGNQIFKNSKQLEELYGDILNKVIGQNTAVNDCINSINMANKNYGGIAQRVKECEDYAKLLSTKINTVKWIDIDRYTDDL